MSSESVTEAFAQWTAAHDALLTAERALAQASTEYAQGTRPAPDDPRAEVDRMRRKSELLLAEAIASMRKR